MLIVCGYLIVDSFDRDALLIDSAAAVRLARETDRCRDFAVSAVDFSRIRRFAIDQYVVVET